MGLGVVALFVSLQTCRLSSTAANQTEQISRIDSLIKKYDTALSIQRHQDTVMIKQDSTIIQISGDIRKQLGIITQLFLKTKRDSIRVIKLDSHLSDIDNFLSSFVYYFGATPETQDVNKPENFEKITEAIRKTLDIMEKAEENNLYLNTHPIIKKPFLQFKYLLSDLLFQLGVHYSTIQPIVSALAQASHTYPGKRLSEDTMWNGGILKQLKRIRGVN